jgi:predicted AAA+ superfamily ATPase
MISRIASSKLKELAGQFKSVALIGPRQSGKTTLARHVFKNKQYVSLENPDTRKFAIEDPRAFLSLYPDGAILDEAQRAPELFSYLQQILDETTTPGKFIITGSNNFLLQESISQSLAGRIAYLYLLPFSIDELKGTGSGSLQDMIYKGFYPPVYDQPVASSKWYSDYIRTYIERDVRQIKNITDLNVFEKFLRLCAGRVGQLLNMKSMAVETGVDNKTIASWIGVLESAFILFRLQPHHSSFNKRIVKMPKLYFYDTGLACSLLGIQKKEQLDFHFMAGPLFENFIISDVIKSRYNNAMNSNLFFWRDNTGHEIDMLIENPDGLYPVEIKYGRTVTQEFFKGLIFWQKISHSLPGTVVYGGEEYQARSNGLNVLPWKRAGEL